MKALDHSLLLSGHDYDRQPQYGGEVEEPESESRNVNPLHSEGSSLVLGRDALGPALGSCENA